MGKGNKTLWSYRAKPSQFPWNGIVWDLSSHAVKNLMELLRQVRKMGPERDRAPGSSHTAVLGHSPENV
jgi:hypothetical protein